MTFLVACDLDSTILYSRRTAAAPIENLVCVEHRDGRPAGFLAPGAAAGLAELAEVATVVAVTTRTPAQLARVQLPGRPRFAIAANGGRLLVDGVEDNEWTRTVAARLAGGAGFAEARRRAESFAAASGGRPYVVEDLFCFVVADDPERPAALLEAEAEWARRSGWRVSLQGRKAYWVPGPLTKSAAVTALADRIGVRTVLAAGDSMLDADLLADAWAGIRPSHGELAAAGWTMPHVEVTAATGAAAGTEIVRWFLARVRDEAASGLGGRRPAAALAAPAADQ